MDLGSCPVSARLFVALAGAATILGMTVGALAASGGAQADEPETVPTPAATVVTPTVATVVPVESVVTPITDMAEASVGSAQQAGDDAGGSDNLFTGVRGAFIGAGIGVGAVALIAAVVAATRAIARRTSR